EDKHVLLLLLLLVVELLSQGCCQHWSYDMSPGGKRQSGSLSETMGNVSILPIHNVEVGLFTKGCDANLDLENLDRMAFMAFVHYVVFVKDSTEFTNN
uniref:Gonadoliberin n=1 Tax=Oncorhynchus tshawytscha TaxID=74940 RepID=A0A8C8J9U6_ONCTS